MKKDQEKKINLVNQLQQEFGEKILEAIDSRKKDIATADENDSDETHEVNK